MKYIDQYFYENDPPDEKSYKESIIKILYDYFYDRDYTFILTNKTNYLPEYGNNVIVFLSGNEKSIIPEYFNKVKFIFTDFYIPNMPDNVHPILLGNNIRTSGGDFYKYLTNNKKISERQIDICFIGAIHRPGSERDIVKNKLKNFKDIKVYGKFYDNFFYEQRTRESIQKENENYFNILKNTKINICTGGNHSFMKIDKYFAGWESYRFLESMHFGNIILTTIDWADYYKSPNVFTIDSWSNLSEEYIKNILSKNLNEIQLKSYDFYKKNISKYAIIQKIINILENRNIIC